MAERKAMTWKEWSVLPSDERIAIRKPLLAMSKAGDTDGMTGEEHMILMIPAPEDEQAIIEAVAADLCNYWRDNVDEAVKEAVDGDMPTR